MRKSENVNSSEFFGVLLLNGLQEGSNFPNSEERLGKPVTKSLVQMWDY